MKITFNNVTKPTNEMSHTDSKVSKPSRANRAYDYSSTIQQGGAYGKEGLSVSDIQQRAKAQDVTVQRNYMAVMSGSMSDEDFGKLLRNGGKPGEESIEDVVTILDKIKLEVAKSGKQIVGFTDTLDDETLEAMTGSRTMVDSIRSEFDTYDIPITKEAVTNVVDTYKEAKEITSLNDTAKRYLVNTGLDLTVDRLYRAQHSVSENTVETSKGQSQYYEIEAPGYFAQKPQSSNDQNIDQVISDFLSDNGIEVNEQTINDSKWMIQNNIPITKDNLERLKKIDSLSLPIAEEAFVKSAAIAYTEGKDCKDAILNKDETQYEEAIRYTYEISDLVDGTKESVVSRRILEEVRLKMTTEANLKLLQSGFHIDTKDIEGYLKQLKELESSLTYQEMREIDVTMKAVEEVKSLPIAVIGTFAYQIPEITLEGLISEGHKLQKGYEAASIVYEQVGTEVRKDLGDSMKKAFRNVDTLLGELNLETNQQNQRAVRILGWNSMEITPESIERVKKADAKVENILTKLSPADTLKLIRKGTSPINMSIDDLNDYVESKESTEEVETEKYSKFLYKLEQDKSISESERKQYIEVYRFFYQLEKTDMAAIGSVLQTGRELTVNNLKSAMKTAKSGGVDVKIREDYGLLVNDIRDSLEPERLQEANLNEQSTIKDYYTRLPETEINAELEKAYEHQQSAEFKEAFSVSDEVITNLLMNNQKVSVDNLRSANVLLKRKGYSFNKVNEIAGDWLSETSDTMINALIDQESASNTLETLCDEAKTQIYENLLTKDNYIDVRELGLVNKQLTLVSSFAKQENYEIPVEIEGQMTSMNLRIVHNDEESNVVITMNLKDESRVSSRLSTVDGQVKGYIASNSRETVSKLQKVADNLGEAVYCVYSKDADKDMDIASLPMKDNKQTTTSELYETAKRFIQLIRNI